MKKYFIGHGSSVIAEFDTLEAMLQYHASMEPLNRHFCKLYDLTRHVCADGWEILFHGSAAWREW